MIIGTGVSTLVFPNGFFPVEGFTEVLTPLKIRALYLGQTSGKAVLIVSIEMTSLPPESVTVFQHIAAGAAGIDPDRCWISVTHTFSAPHILPAHAVKTAQAQKSQHLLQSAVEDAVRIAAQQAVSTREEAALYAGHSECLVNVNRVFETPDGWWHGYNEAAAADHTLHALYWKRNDGSIKAVLCNFAVQPSMFDGAAFRGGGKPVTGDLAGMVCTELEEAHPGSTVLFMPGPAGDQAPRRCIANAAEGKPYVCEDTISRCRELAGEMARNLDAALQAGAAEANEALHLMKGSVTLPAQKMLIPTHDLRPTHTFTFVPDGETELPIEILTLGTTAIIGMKPELCTETSVAISNASPYSTTWIATMVNGGAKYMPEAIAYDRITYQAMNSPFGKGAAERFAKKALQLLSDTKNRNKAAQ